MKKLVLSTVAACGLLLVLPETAFAHGGQYRGPGDVVPPSAGGGGRSPGPRGPSTPGPSGPTTPGPSGPSTPGPSGPVSAGPTAPTGPTGPTTGARGATLDVDLNKWQFWWEFNKDPFINLKEAIHAATAVTGSDEFFLGGTKRQEASDTQKPTDTDVLTRVLPSLKRALDGTDQRDIVSSCLVAMAKIGKNHNDFKILDVMRPHLRAKDQEIQETAALAMGISQMPEAIEDLIEIAKDSSKGRSLCDTSEVNFRTRAFACYGLGLIAYATSNTDNKRLCFEALKDVLAKTTNPMVNPNIPIATINGIRLIRPNAAAGEKDKKLLDDCMDTLWTFFTKKEGATEQQVQSHVPPAIAQLLGRGGDKAGKYKDAFVDILSGKAGKLNNNMYQSAVIGLGLLAQPQEIEKGDKKYSDALLAYFNDGKDEQARNFSLMAMAKIGGAANRNELLKAFAKGSTALVKPWAAISLGVLAFENAQAAGDAATIDRTIGETLDNELQIKNPETLAAVAVALGLCKYTDAADHLEELLEKNKHQEELAGYICIGLALMGNTRSIDPIRTIVENSVRKPDLLKQAAIALGKMGDKEVADQLERMLSDGDTTVARLSAIASALGYIGDRRTIDPLVRMLQNEQLPELSRAFAAVALGGIADKEPLPWNSKIAVDMNYRAAVETLTDQATGILDIL